MKTKNLFLSIPTALALLFGCSESDPQEATPSDLNPAIGAPVETNAPNSNYKPAFTGQTRVNSVKTSTPFAGTMITSSLTAPWGITTLPDGRLLVTEKAGRLRIVTTTGQVGSPISGIQTVKSAGQGGLLGLTIDPQFESNRMIYWVFSEAVTGGTVTSVAKGKLSSNETSIESPTVIYRAAPAFNGDLHYGGRIVFDKTGNILVSIGERSSLTTRPLAQSVTASLGKVVRITTSGQAAPGNPTFSTAGALPELYTMGHRNPQGLAVHPVTGEIWQGEHGPRGGDEINRLQPGFNYGWPTITYGIEYGGEKIGAGIQVQTGLEQPVYYWDPVVSPGGMTFYKGNKVPEWQNNLFIGSLSATHVVRLVIENNKVVGEERLLALENQRFRDITQGTDGALYAITDGGRLYKIDKL